RQVDNMPLETVVQRMEEMRDRVSINVDALPTHADFLNDYCFDSKAQTTETARV
ncbi:MAG: hypothetical protein JF615_13355, partial [Asticcacaulis sp.]|nr:hypothetical protein [Asticcacaulis sp.]